MVVLDDICEKCNCICNAIHFQQNFKNWTSGNDNIDKFIQDAQLSAHGNAEKALEWIPYGRFYIKHIVKVGFGTNIPYKIYYLILAGIMLFISLLIVVKVLACKPLFLIYYFKIKYYSY